MMEKLSRRSLLIDTALARATWTTLAAQSHRHQDKAIAAPGKLQFFTPIQAAIVEAMAAQIIPADDTPGAREVGVIHFIDRALVTFDREQQTAYTEGLKGMGDFAELPPARQLDVLRAMEKSEFFGLVRTHTIMGFFSHPQYGGNRDRLGWKLIGFEDAPFSSRPSATTTGRSGMSHEPVPAHGSCGFSA